MKDPTYEQVCGQETGHAEAILIDFDPKQVSYQTLVRHFFRMHDPTQFNRQDPDVGENYRSAIFYKDEMQKQQAQQIKAEIQKGISGRLVTEVTPAGPFYKAEAYHQKLANELEGACAMFRMSRSSSTLISDENINL